MNDTELLDYWEKHSQYVIGFAPSGDWSAFDYTKNITCYGKTLRECFEKMKEMHESVSISFRGTFES